MRKPKRWAFITGFTLLTGAIAVSIALAEPKSFTIADGDGNPRYTGLLGVVIERDAPAEYAPGGTVDVEVTLRYHDSREITG